MRRLEKNLQPPDATWKRQFRGRIRRWFGRHARELPWRQTKDPYHVWVSEIMLQQTQVATVIPYFERFIADFPTIDALAAAPEEQVLRRWEGLGYYRRARQLHRAAQLLVSDHAGRFPRDVETVRGLPGIGRYTAGAILSIAFDDRQPILEANTVRLFSRLLAYRDDPRSNEGQRVLWQFAEEILPTKHVGDFNQGLMEVGSVVCRPVEPECPACPVAPLCPTQAQGLQREIPVAARKVRYEEVSEVCVVVRRGQRILLRRCEPDERWAGLWDFPRFPLPPGVAKPDDPKAASKLGEEVRRATGVTIGRRRHLTTIKHGVTRFRITLICYESEYEAGRLRGGEQRWVEPEELEDYPLSVTGRKIAKKLIA